MCRAHDVPTVDDEIQTCLWAPRILLYRQYGLRPDVVVLGKGLSGGEYPASRVLFSAELDALPQFGALVTNGQEELASLAYLVTIRWALANAEQTQAVGAYYEQRLAGLVQRYPHLLAAVHGRGHLAGLHLPDLAVAKTFAKALVGRGLDISVQTYKSSCPPAALTKLPLTAGYEMVDWIAEQFQAALSELE